jgi:hypothetical protein
MRGRAALTLQGAGAFRDAGLVEKLRCGGRAQVFPVLQDPDDSLIGSDFDDLNNIGTVLRLGASGS